VFNVTGIEIVLVLLVALIVLGPEKLPEAVRRFGRTYGELKRMSQGFQSELRDALEEPSRELRSTVQAAKDMVHGPVQEVRSTAKDVKDMAQGRTTTPGPPTPSPAAAPAAAPPTPAGDDPAAGDPAADGMVPDELWDGEPEA
jgi:sec-independent protein translocase protein TatB